MTTALFSVGYANAYPVAYKVTVWPETVQCMDQALWCVTVRYEGFGNWSVRRGNLSGDAPVLGRDREWHYENLPSDRTREEIAEHRFAYDEAMKLAADMASRVEVNGITATEAVIRHLTKGQCLACEGPYTA